MKIKQLSRNLRRSNSTKKSSEKSLGVAPLVHYCTGAHNIVVIVM